jgi:hypothetical protein
VINSLWRKSYSDLCDEFRTLSQELQPRPLAAVVIERPGERVPDEDDVAKLEHEAGEPPASCRTSGSLLYTRSVHYTNSFSLVSDDLTRGNALQGAQLLRRRSQSSFAMTYASASTRSGCGDRARSGITGGSFRLLDHLLTQIGRIIEINELHTVTPAAVEAARESLVIGTVQ